MARIKELFQQYQTEELRAAAQYLLDADDPGIPSITLARIVEDHFPGALLRRIAWNLPGTDPTEDFHVILWFKLNGQTVRLDGRGSTRAVACMEALTGERIVVENNS